MRLYLAYFNLVACDLVPFDSNFETECKLFTQHLVLGNDCCISRNVGRTKINLITSNKLYYFLFIADQSSMETTVVKLEILGYKEFRQRG